VIRASRLTRPRRSTYKDAVLLLHPDRRSVPDVATLPLLKPCDTAPIAWRQSTVVDRRAFLAHVAHLAESLTQARYTVNLCEDRYCFLVAFAAVIASGKTNLLPPSRAPQDQESIRAAYADHQLIDDVQVEAAITGVPQNLASAAAGPIPEIPMDHEAVIVFTSGSTGKSRAHIKRWGDLVRHAHCAEQRFGFHRRGVAIVATVPAQHMYGLETSVMVPLACGAGVFGGRPFYAEDIRAALSAVPPPRALVTTPIHLRVCAESGLEWPAVAFIISATAPLPAKLARQAESVFDAPVMEIYGCTEAGSLASRRRLDGDLWHSYDGMSVYASNGGFYVRAVHLPEPAPLSDVLVLRDATHFELAGRQADMVNVAGKRASLGDLNLRLNDIEGVRDAIFVAPDDASEGSARLLALVVAPELTEGEIVRRLAERIDPAFMPRPLYKIDRLPRNELGKLPRAELLALIRQLKARG
jgi:acyl-coenzyme A synthetase/AMP-(fatty) acid ligase